MTGYVCARCGHPTGRWDPWCDHCHDNVIAIQTEPEPGHITPEQRAYIRGLYKHHGLHSTAWMLGHLGRHLGRPITGLDQITTHEYEQILPSIREWSYG